MAALALGTLFALFAAAVTYVFCTEVFSADEPLAVLLFPYAVLFFLWGFPVIFFLGAFRSPRLRDLSGEVAGVGLLVLFVAMVLSFFANPQGVSHVKGAWTMTIILSGVIGIGLPLYILCLMEERGGHAKGRVPAGMYIVFIWPVQVLGGSLGSILIALATIGLTYIGERLGARFGHPFWGALSGLGVPVLLLIAFAATMTRLEIKEKTAQENLFRMATGSPQTEDEGRDGEKD